MRRYQKTDNVGASLAAPSTKIARRSLNPKTTFSLFRYLLFSAIPSLSGAASSAPACAGKLALICELQRSCERDDFLSLSA